MKTVETEVVARILETLQELTASGALPGRRKESVAEFQEEDRLVFLFLEEELSRRGICALNQLPIGGEKSVVQFANNLPTHPALFAVLQKLEFTECIPLPLQSKVTRLTTPCPYFTATGYHAVLDQSTNQSSIFDLGDFVYPTVIGYALPHHMIPTRIGKMYDIFRIFRTPSHFASVHHQQLGLPVLSATGFRSRIEPKPGYNIGHKKPYGDIAFTFVREYRQFALSLNPSTTPLQSSFITAVKELTTGDNGRGHGVSEEAWTHFFHTFGTHVITRAHGGGRVVLTVLENHLKNFFGVTDLSREKVEEVELALATVLDGEATTGHETIPNWQSTGELSTGKELLISSIKLEGGDSTYGQLDLTTCHKPGERKNLVTKWSQTLPFAPIMLNSSITIESITNILEQSGLTQEARLVDVATQRIFGKSFAKRTRALSEGRSWW